MNALALCAALLVSKLDVAVSGPGFTSSSAMRRLMSTQEGSAYDPSALERDLARLRTMGILYDVSARTTDSPAGKLIEVDARDRWSLLPMFGLRHGGGRTTARVGASDHNAFGRLFTIYGALTSNADIPFTEGRVGSTVSLEVPRIFGTRFQPALLWSRNFFDFAAFREGAPGYVFDRARYDLRFEARYEVSDLVSLMLGADARRDRYSASDFSRAPGALPPSGGTTSVLAGVEFGYIEQSLSQLYGRELQVQIQASRAGVLGSDFGAISGSLLARGFFLPLPQHNICLQFLLQATTSGEESFLFHAGGLSEIRGFMDSYFTGAVMARYNAEWRADVVQSNFAVPFIGQVAAFVDGGYVGARSGAVSGLDYQGPILSAGVGLRFVPIPFARAVGRIDIATGIVPSRTFDVSFSGQQFF
jgi:hypothetical protein